MSPVVVTVFLLLCKLAGTFEEGIRRCDVARTWELAASLACFLVSGPAVIILNKHIMKDHHFEFPIALASLGQVLMLAVTRTSVWLGLCELEAQTMAWGTYLRVVLLMNCFSFGTQVVGMWSYMFVSLPEIQVLKSLTVVLVLALSVVILREPINSYVVVAVLVIVAGAVISALHDDDPDRISVRRGAHAIGIILCVLASLFEAAKMVCSHILMHSLRVFDGIYWSSPAFVLLAAVFVAALDLKGLLDYQFTWHLVGLLVLNAFVTGFCVFSTFWFVKLVGALSLKVTTQARTVGLILVSVYFFHEHCAPLTYIGYSVILVGVGLHDRGKRRLLADKLEQQEQVLDKATVEDRTAESSQRPPGKDGFLQQPGENGFLEKPTEKRKEAEGWFHSVSRYLRWCS